MHTATMHHKFHVHNVNTNQYCVLMGHDAMFLLNRYTHFGQTCYLHHTGMCIPNYMVSCPRK